MNMHQEFKPNFKNELLDSFAISLVEKLQKQNFKAFLVGGCVRDLMLNIKPKDFDIVTNALPEDIRKIISNAHIIGKRFRLVLVKQNFKQYEISTYRREATEEDKKNTEVFGDNFYGSQKQDAYRRDFTINSLFYDPIKNIIIDYTGGLEDLKNGIIRMIGEPSIRLKEDSIRILRALRLAHKLHFSIEPKLKKYMAILAVELKNAVLPRKREEILKLMRLSEPQKAFNEAFDLGVLKIISKTLNQVFEQNKQDIFDKYISISKEYLNESSEPQDLFSFLYLAYFRSCITEDISKKIRSKDLLSDHKQKEFLRSELGMSNFEQKVVTASMEMMSYLGDKERFARKGDRRKYGFIKQDGFLNALIFAKIDLLLDPELLQYWEDSYKEYLPKLEKEKLKMKQNKKSRFKKKIFKKKRRFF